MASLDNKPSASSRGFSAEKEPGSTASPWCTAETTVYKRKSEQHYRFLTHTAICFVYEGSLLIKVGDKSYSASAGDLYVMRPGTEWSCSFDGRETARILSLYTAGRLPDAIIEGYLNEGDVFYPQSGCKGLSDRLLEMGERPDVGQRELFDECMLFLLRVCQRLSASRAGEDEATLPERIRYHILRYAMGGKLSVKSIAKAFSIRAQDLQKLFKESFGMTVHHYVQNVRLKRAAELLAMSSISISQIAEETGYADRCYLDKLFLKKYGVTPSAYRKMHTRSE